MAESKVPEHEVFDLNVNKLFKGSELVLDEAVSTFSFHWDFENGMGIAHLIDINESMVNITLHPIGLAGRLAFMSDIPPTPFRIGDKEVVIYRVILNIMLDSGEKSAAIMFNDNGSVIQITPNFDTGDSSEVMKNFNAGLSASAE